MATFNSRSFRKGQVNVTCNLCEREVKLSWKCLNCNMLMCDHCKDNTHAKFKFHKNHKIIDIKEVGQHTKELDLSDIKCEEHAGQNCCMFCKSCDRLVCPLCIVRVHNGHGLTEISEGFAIRTESLKDDKKKMLESIKEMGMREYKVKNIEIKEKFKYEEAKKNIQAHNTALKFTIDLLTGKLMEELDEIWHNLCEEVEEERSRVAEDKKNHEIQYSNVENLLQSEDAANFFKESRKIENGTNKASNPLVETFISIPRFMPGEITERNIGYLQRVTHGDPAEVKVKIIQQYDTDISSIFFLSVGSEGSVWISDQNVIQKVKVKPEGNSLKVESDFHTTIRAMVLTPANDLLLAVWEQTALQKLNEKTNKLNDSEYSFNQLIPTAIYITCNKIMVGAKSPGKSFPASGRRPVMVMNDYGDHEAVFERDRCNKLIFTYVECLTTSENGNIFAVDELSEDGTGQIIVLDQRGDIVEKYTGHPDINTKDKPFKPLRILTTPSDNIIVTELHNYIIHILNNTGQIGSHFNMEDVGIIRPFSMSYDANGHLFIGCNTPVGTTDKAKLYKVEISGC